MLYHWAKGVLWELLKLRPQKYVTSILHTVRSGMLICAYHDLCLSVNCLLACFFKCQNCQSHYFFGDSPSIVKTCECWIKTVSTMDFILIHLRNVMSFCFCRPCFSLTSYFPSGVRPLLLISYHMTTIRQSEQSSLLETVRGEEYHNHFKTFLS